MASQEEKRAQGFANAPRPQQPPQRPQGGGEVPLGDMGDRYAAAPGLGDGATNATMDANSLAMFSGAMQQLHLKAAELQGGQLLLQAVAKYRATGEMPNSAIAPLVQQYIQLEDLANKMRGDSGFFTQKGGTVVLNPLPQLTEEDFSRAIAVMANPQRRHLLPSNHQQQLTGS